MHTFYVDIPNDFEYNWEIISGRPTKSCQVSEVLSVMTGAEVKFICNSYARLSVGDVYAVTVDSELEEVLYLLKTGFRLLDYDEIEEYSLTKKLREISNFEIYRG